jgi:hypothetical protein
MTLECLDLEGEGWSDALVQTCLPKPLYHNQFIDGIQKAAGSRVGMINAYTEKG